MMKGLNKDIYHRELSTLLKSSSIINSSLQIKDVLDSAMKAAEEFMEAEASSVFDFDQENGEISVRLARGEKGGFIQDRKLKPGEGVASWVIESGKPLMVEDVQKHRCNGI